MCRYAPILDASHRLSPGQVEGLKGRAQCLPETITQRAATRSVRLGDPVLDRYLEFVESRARHNTLLATASDLKAFFGVVDKAPAEVTPADVLGFIAEQRKPKGDGRVVRLADGESGLAARTIKRRLSSVSGLFSYLMLCGDVAVNPVPRGLATRRGGGRGVALIRSPRTLPKILSPDEVNALMAALRHHRRLREAGMALEAVQAQAGHRSLESTRVYLHLANDWLAAEYIRAASIIDAAVRDEFEAVAR